ncbi:unnamed protein product [[Candida] boidinii]|uniref:non-specific serine/threonine protein kinase n=1 Tax=Candida boidinii TaxID=5477 RepID=A0A9W6T1A5_CANBO|nr:hypothetical protein B5S30_g5429 [[Candida] boidinii]GME69144.1 unnamed protein product [[Candida] boidinii]GMF99656.1 unnamed protein product [[Candida] boidinii]
MVTQAPPTAYKPGTALTVGSHKVVITKYLSQGGFAHVYTCTISPPWNNTETACLKRVAVPDKHTLNVLRQEVDAMRRLAGKSCIVSYIDSHAARMLNGVGYEVFLLMEYCAGNGLIDFMNQRLVHKLTEPEILQIMGEVTEGVAHMHALNPPLIHRDIKIENVLLTSDHKHYKLCDFGSASAPLRPPKNVDEFQVLQDDIMRHTTPQYRAPEMLDLYRRQPIDEKSDIWALGVFLYKLCYYTTPFENNSINGAGNGGGGDYAILNGRFSFPASPIYSSNLKNVISKCLVVNPVSRPNVYQLLQEICRLRKVPYPNIHPEKTPSVPERSFNSVSGTTTPIHSTNTPSNIKDKLALPPKPQSNYSRKSSSDEEKRPSLPARKQIASIPVPAPSPQQTNQSNYSTTNNNNKNYDDSLHRSKSEKVSNSHYDPFANIDRTSFLTSTTKKSSTTYGNLSDNNKDLFQKRMDSYITTSGADTAGLGVTTGGYSKNSGIRSNTTSSANLNSINGVNSSSMSKSQKSRSTPKSFNYMGSKNNDDSRFTNVQSDIMSGIQSEEVVELSPSNHHNIRTSVDFLRDLSRQDSGKSWREQKTGDSIKSFMNMNRSANKRSSISSLKGLLTGGKNRDASSSLNRQSAARNLSQNYTNSSHRSSSGNLRSIESLRDNVSGNRTGELHYRVQQRSKSFEKPSEKNELAPKVPVSRPHKRQNSIQRRVHALLTRDESPPATKTAHGYGKYTDDSSFSNTNNNNHNNNSNNKSSSSHRGIELYNSDDFDSDNLSDSDDEIQYRRSFDGQKPPTGRHLSTQDAIKVSTSKESHSRKTTNQQIGNASSMKSPIINLQMYTTPTMQSGPFKSPSTVTSSSFSPSSTLSTTSTVGGKKVPPKKPAKPSYLKSSSYRNIDANSTNNSSSSSVNEIHNHFRKISDTSDFDDVEAMEKSFMEKFPNAV